MVYGAAKTTTKTNGYLAIPSRALNRELFELVCKNAFETFHYEQTFVDLLSSQKIIVVSCFFPWYSS